MLAVPVGHSAHDVDAGDAANVPAVQLLHVDAAFDVEMVPTGQLLHATLPFVDV